MLASALVAAGVLYWAVYVIAIAVGVPVALALLFGVLQTAKWFKKGGKGNPHSHRS
ncbi:MAG TPA: hypothetical protein VI759_01880 [Dehalococcoidia bacterium]|nr:hypothetical protein [Dehalococcoidia bacterium]